MSLLLSPVLFGLLGIIMARASKMKRIWRRHNRFVWTVGSMFAVTLLLVLVSLMADLAWTQGWSRHLPGGSGPVWMWSSGVFHDDLRERLPEHWDVVIPLLAFTLMPLWYRLGLTAGFWLFGRSPKQTGIIGLLR